LEQGAVSPDGKQIAFTRGDHDRQELWLMDADGDHPRRLMDAEGGDYGSVIWSRDGRRVVYLRYVFKPTMDSGEVSIEACDPASGQTEVILRNPRLWNALVWTPDDRVIYSLQTARIPICGRKKLTCTPTSRWENPSGSPRAPTRKPASICPPMGNT